MTLSKKCPAGLFRVFPVGEICFRAVLGIPSITRSPFDHPRNRNVFLSPKIDWQNRLAKPLPQM